MNGRAEKDYSPEKAASPYLDVWLAILPSEGIEYARDEYRGVYLSDLFLQSL